MHPLEKFHFCPVCGSSHFADNNFKSRRCQDCGFTYYFNPSSATVAVIVNSRGELLVATRKKAPARGTLDLPGGFVDMAETLEEGVAREVMEETHLKVTKAQYLFSLPNLYEYSGFTVHTLDSFFRCEVEDDTLVQADDDAADLQWIPLGDLRPEPFGLASIRRGVSRLLEGGHL